MLVPEYFSLYDGTTNCVTEIASGNEGRIWLGLHQGQVFQSRRGEKYCLCDSYHNRTEQKYLATAVLVSVGGDSVYYSFVGCKFNAFKCWNNERRELDFTAYVKPKAFLATCALVPTLCSSDRHVFRLAFGIGLNHLKLYQMQVRNNNTVEQFEQIGVIKSNSSGSFTSAGFDETALNIVAFSGLTDDPVARMHEIPLNHDVNSTQTFPSQREFSTKMQSNEAVHIEIGGWMGNQLLAGELIKRDHAIRNSKHWNDTISLKRDLFPAWLVDSTEFEGHKKHSSSESYYGEQLFVNTLQAERRLVYKGWWLRGRRNGHGEEFDLDLRRLVYEGNFQANLRHGHGIEYHESYQYQGSFLCGKRHGFGVLTYIKDRAGPFAGGFTSKALKGTKVQGFFCNDVLQGIAHCKYVPDDEGGGGAFVLYENDTCVQRLGCYAREATPQGQVTLLEPRLPLRTMCCWACSKKEGELSTCSNCSLVIHLGKCLAGDSYCPFEDCNHNALTTTTATTSTAKRVKKNMMEEAQLAFDQVRQYYVKRSDAIQSEFAAMQAQREAEVSHKLRLEAIGLEQEWREKTTVRGGNAEQRLTMQQALAKLELAKRDPYDVKQMDDQAMLACLDELYRLQDEVERSLI